MTKQSSKSPKQVAPALQVGDRVLASVPSLSDDNLAGTIEAITQTGWLRVRLDVALDKVGVKDGCISCRMRSLIALPADWTPADPIDEEADDEDGEFFQANREAGPADTGDDDAEEAGEEPEEEETVGGKMAQALAHARVHYVKCKRPNGTATAHNGDDIAKSLRDYEPNEVADMADKCLKLPIGTHFLKYGHLNNGQIRMNSGNRIRATYAKALKDQDAETINHICHVLGLDDDPDEEQVEESNDE